MRRLIVSRGLNEIGKDEFEQDTLAIDGPRMIESTSDPLPVLVRLIRAEFDERDQVLKPPFDRRLSNG